MADETPAETRPLPPPLDFPYPPCSICGEECQLEDNSFRCAPCGASWPTDGAPEGDWDEPKAQPCMSTYRPWAAQRYADMPILHQQVYRCALEAGHVAAERGAAKHVDPEWRDGWTDKEAMPDA